MTIRILTGTVVTGLMAISQLASAAAPGIIEMDEARRWAGARFEGKVETGGSKAGLIVLANNDPVTRLSLIHI